jgi:hypothetical protein
VFVLAHAHGRAFVIGLGADQEDLAHEERVGHADDRAHVERVLCATDGHRHVDTQRVELVFDGLGGQIEGRNLGHGVYGICPSSAIVA